MSFSHGLQFLNFIFSNFTIRNFRLVSRSLNKMKYVSVGVTFYLLIFKAYSCKSFILKWFLSCSNSHWAIKILRHICFHIFFWVIDKNERVCTTTCIIIAALYARRTIKSMQQRKEVLQKKPEFQVLNGLRMLETIS